METQQHFFESTYRDLIHRIIQTDAKYFEENDKSDKYHQKEVASIDFEHKKASAVIDEDYQKETSATTEGHKRRKNSYEEELRQRDSQARINNQCELNKAKLSRDALTSQVQADILNKKSTISDCVVAVNKNKKNALEYLNKLGASSDFFSKAKHFKKVKLTDESNDSLQQILNQTVTQSSKDKETLEQLVEKIIKTRATNVKIRKFAIVALSIIGIIICADALIVNNQKYLNNEYNIAVNNLDNGRLDTVIDHINALESKLSFRQHAMPLFFGEAAFSRLVGIAGAKFSYKSATQYYLLQREALYRRAMIAYKSGNWPVAMNNFAQMLNNSALISNTCNNKSAMDSELKRYRDKKDFTDDFISGGNKYDLSIYRSCKQAISKRSWSDLSSYITSDRSTHRMSTRVIDEVVIGTWRHNEYSTNKHIHGNLMINKKTGDNSYGGSFDVSDRRGGWAKQSANVTWIVKSDGLYLDVQCSVLQRNKAWSPDHLNLKIGRSVEKMEGSNKDANGNGGYVVLKKI
jgi:hypothetical protein